MRFGGTSSLCLAGSHSCISFKFSSFVRDTTISELMHEIKSSDIIVVKKGVDIISALF